MTLPDPRSFLGLVSPPPRVAGLHARRRVDEDADVPQALGSALVLAAVAATLAVGASAAIAGDRAPATRGAASIDVGLAGPGPVAEPYVLPLVGESSVIHPFVTSTDAWAAGHRGVDLASSVGAPVLAPASGTVTFAGTIVDRGVITVAHPDGLRSSLEPVTPLVRAGVRVTSGQVIGTVASAAGHCAPAACVHWGVRRGDAYQDPLRLVSGGGPVVLLGD